MDRTRVTGLLREGDRVVGAEAETNGQTRRFGARLVVGADGRHSFIANEVGATEYFAYDAPRAMYWAYWDTPVQWKQDPAYTCDFYLGHVGKDIRVIFPTDHDQLLIGTLPPVAEARRWRQDLPRNYREDLSSNPLIAPLIEGREPEGKIRGVLSERYFFRQAAGPGWALAGDAGHHKEFVLGDGITEALLQVRALSNAIKADSDEALLEWSLRRDVEAWELYCFGQDEGALERPMDLMESVLAGVARRPRLKQRLAKVFERSISPYDALPVSAILTGLARAVSKGKWQAVPQFFRQAKRVSSVKRELGKRRALLNQFVELVRPGVR